MRLEAWSCRRGWKDVFYSGYVSIVHTRMQCGGLLTLYELGAFGAVLEVSFQGVSSFYGRDGRLVNELGLLLSVGHDVIV
jgi:hypothetical protein